MLLHANAIAQNRAPGVRARRIHRDDSDDMALLAIVARQLIDKRALAGAGRPGQPKNPRMPTLTKKYFEQLRPARQPVFDRSNGPRQRSRITRANLISQKTIGRLFS